MVDKYFCDRFIKAMKNSGFTQVSLAKELDIRRTSLSEIKNHKREPKMEYVRKFLQISDISSDWLLTGRGEMFLHDEADEQPIYNNKECICDKVCVNVLGRIAAGIPLEIDNTEPLYCVDIDKKYIPFGYNINSLLCFEAQGNSMSPKIEDGDLVFIEKSTDWLNCEGKICAVRVDGECTLKILEIDGQHIFLHPINKEHKTQVYDAGEQEVFLVGKMVMHIQINVTVDKCYL